MKLMNFTKKKGLAFGLAFGVAAGAGGIAAAYFTATGTGSGNAQVGSATPFVVTQKSLAGTLYPGQTASASFTIHNVGGGIQHYTVAATDVYIAKNLTGYIITAFQTTPTKSVVHGCMASWFTTTITSGASGTLNPNGSATLAVKLHMTNGTATHSTQDACQATFPKLTVAFGGPAGFGLIDQEGGIATWPSKTTAHLSIPPGAPGYAPPATGAAAGVEVLNPPATLPTTAPKMTATNYAAGTPRWVIVFATGAHVFGYPTNATGVGGKWGTGLGIGSSYTTWAGVLTAAATVGNVSQVFIVLDTSHGSSTTSTITNVTYGGLGF